MRIKMPHLKQAASKLQLDAPMMAADDFYEALLDAHLDLSMEESTAFNARLVLIMAHQIGDLPSLKAALQAAKRSAA
jgi:hypothetical protein